MRFGAAELDAVLRQYLPPDATGLVVGVSGGGDSACLLSALAELPHRPVRAVHVDHGLQDASVALRGSSIALCERLQIPLTVIEVAVEADGESLEAAERGFELWRHTSGWERARVLRRTAALLRRDPQTPILIKADTTVAYGAVVRAMVLLQQAGAAKVGFLTDPPEKPPGGAR